MKCFPIKDVAGISAIAVLLFFSACSPTSADESGNKTARHETFPAGEGPSEPAAQPSPVLPDLQAEIMDERGKSTTSPLGTFDFKNFTYPLPRGWQHQDGDEIVLTDGRLIPKFQDITEEMTPEEKAAARAVRRIGMRYVTTKFLDIDGDGVDEAVVILKVETGGSAIPQLVYVYTWKDGGPELIWNFRTGDRADGGLKDIRVENGGTVVELYGQDRFILGEVETGKITGDEEQLCCPTHFTRSFYKWNGSGLLLQGKRLTYETANPSGRPLENLGDIVNDPVRSKEYFKALEKKNSN
jgi:hypothetical protein